MPDDADRQLLERFVQGDQEAFERLFRQFEREVYGWILRITRDPTAAEDALIDAFWRAYRGRARFDSSRGFGAWMRRIATNSALDQLRKLRARQSTLGPQSTWRPPSGGPLPAQHDLREAIRLAFGKLPPRLLVVATLALVEERSHAEIAEALDLPVGTVKSRVFRATRLLRKEMTRLGITET
jgi:RNA polymerase sigma-70 factor (ECF subfamily)